MKIYQVFRDGYDGSDETDSFWINKAKAEEQCTQAEKNNPDEINGFEWEVVEYETED